MSTNELQGWSCFTDILTSQEIINSITVSLTRTIVHLEFSHLPVQNPPKRKGVRLIFSNRYSVNEISGSTCRSGFLNQDITDTRFQ